MSQLIENSSKLSLMFFENIGIVLELEGNSFSSLLVGGITSLLWRWNQFEMRDISYSWFDSFLFLHYISVSQVMKWYYAPIILFTYVNRNYKKGLSISLLLVVF